MRMGISLAMQQPRWPGLAGFAGIVGGGEPDLAFDFMANVAWVKGTGYVAADSPLTTVRATPTLAYADDLAGAWSSFAPNVVRRTNKGVLSEEARTNSLRNNSMTGAVVGTPGTLPTVWAGASAGLTRNVIAVGVENGVDYVDIQYVGTTNTTFFALTFEDTVQIVAANGQIWAASAFAKLVGGSLTNITNTFLYIEEETAAGALVVSGGSAFTPGATLTRVSHIRTLAGGGTVARVRSFFIWTCNNASAVDFTIRVGWPQLELGAFVTSPIRTTTVAVTRAADVVSSVVAIPGDYSLFAQASSPNYIQATGAPIVAQLDSGGINDRGYLWRVSGSPIAAGSVVVGGSLVANIAGATWANSTSRKLALGAQLNNYVLTFNGAVSGTDLVGVLPLAPTALRIGNNSGTTGNFGGWIEKVAFWNSRLTNTQLQAITAP